MVSKFVQQLQSQHPNRRLKAVRRLSQSDKPGAVEALISALGDDEESVARAAMEALANITSPGLVRQLTAVFRESEVDRVPGLAAEAMARTGEAAAIRFLVETLNTPATKLNQWTAAAMALAAINWQPTNARQTVFFVLAQRSGTYGSIVALGESAVAPLLELIRESPAAIVRSDAAKLLVAVNWRPSTDAERHLVITQLVHSIAVKELAQLGDPNAVKLLIAVPDLPSWVLPKLGSSILLKALADEDPAVRLAVAEALAEIADPATVGALTDALSAQELAVREQIARALAKIGDPSTAVVLGEILRSSEYSVEVRCAVASALGAMKNAASLGPLVDAIKAGDTRLRNAAIDALGELADPRAAETLLDVLADDSAEASHASAAKALAKLRSGRAVKPLVELAQHRDGEASLLLVHALQSVLHTSAGMVTNQDLEIVATLPDRFQYVQTWQSRDEEGRVSVHKETKTIDCSPSKELARLELARRHAGFRVCPNPGCAKEIRVTSDFFGKEVQCRFCETVFVLSADGIPQPVAPVVHLIGCPNANCDKTIRIPEQFFGKRVRCDFCETVFSVSKDGKPHMHQRSRANQVNQNATR